MIDLMQLQAITLATQKLKRRESYQDGFRVALFKRVDGDHSLLRLEEDSQEEVNLDDITVWKQKKVKEKAVQLFSLLAGREIKSKVIRLGIIFLRDNQKFLHTEFKKFLIENGYSEKTAQSQSKQMVLLFNLLKITNGEHLINDRSLIWNKCLELVS